VRGGVCIIVSVRMVIKTRDERPWKETTVLLKMDFDAGRRKKERSEIETGCHCHRDRDVALHLCVDSSPGRGRTTIPQPWMSVAASGRAAGQAVDPCAWEKKKKKQEETGAACLRFCPEKKAVGLFAS
jgi:hypothetical protein